MRLDPSEANYLRLEAWALEDKADAARLRNGFRALTSWEGDSARPQHDPRQQWIDVLAKKAEELRGDHWRKLWVLADVFSWSELNDRGLLRDGVFLRGHVEGDGERVVGVDEARSLHYSIEAIRLARKELAEGWEKDPAAVAELLREVAEDWFAGDEFELALTEIKLPQAPYCIVEKLSADQVSDDDWGWRFSESLFWGGRDESDVGSTDPSSALDAGGELNLPKMPESFAKARWDSERFRWLMAEAQRIAPQQTARSVLAVAEHWRGLLGVPALDDSGWYFLGGTESEFDPQAPGELELHTLKDDETILLSPTGPRRYRLPENFCFIGMYKRLVADQTADSDLRQDARDHLAEIYADRRQFATAAQYAREHDALLPEDAEAWEKVMWQFQKRVLPIATITAPQISPAGTKPQMTLISRNTESVIIEAWKLDVAKVFFPVPKSEVFDAWRDSSPADAKKWSGEYFSKVEEFEIPVRKKIQHLDSRTNFELDLTEAGTYRLFVRGDSGEGMPIMSTMLTIEKNVLGSYPSGGGRNHTVLVDGASGRPVAGAQIYAPSYRSGWKQDGTVDSLFTSDRMGVVQPGEKFSPYSQIVVRTSDGLVELKSMELGGVERYDDECFSPYTEWQADCFIVTNQPLYRPGQQVAFSGWLRHAKSATYSTEAIYGDTEVEIEVEDASGAEIFNYSTRADKFGAFSADFELPSAVALGAAQIAVRVLERRPWAMRRWEQGDDLKMASEKVLLGLKTFQVAEFKKPEFIVSLKALAPAGEGKLRAELLANYFSGEPLRQAKVRFKMRASRVDQEFFPDAEYDWLYGKGYEWTLPSSSWYPGWKRWGVARPATRATDYDDDDDHGYWSENLVDDRVEASTDENGRCVIEFDAEFPDLGVAAYTVTVDSTVMDAAGRTLTATEELLHTGRSVELEIRPDRGFYREGEPAVFYASAFDTDGTGQKGGAELKLLRITPGDAWPPNEIEVFSKQIEFSGDRRVEVPWLSEAGQYRVSLSDGKHERAAIFNVLGGDVGGQRYSPLQITPARTVCRAGESLELAIHTREEDCHVWLFQFLPGQAEAPRLLRTENHVAMVTLPISHRDSPNFFIGAMTIRNGKSHTDICQINVPQVGKFLDVSVRATPSKAQPGDVAELVVEVNDSSGRPVDASLAVTVYDRALAEIAPPEDDKAREFFYGVPFEILLSSRASCSPSPWDEPEPFAYEYWMENDIGIFDRNRGSLYGNFVWKPQGQFYRIGDNSIQQHDPPEIPQTFGGSGMVVGAQKKVANNRAPRRHFADRAYWGAAVRTGKDGRSVAKFTVPDGLTAWKAQAWALDEHNRAGDGVAEIQVSKSLQLRLVVPRSAVLGDLIEVVALVQNLSEKKSVGTGLLEIPGGVAIFVDGESAERHFEIPPGGETRLNWRVTLAKTGVVTFRATCIAGEAGDGMEMQVPVIAIDHRAAVSQSGTLTKEERSRDLRLLVDDVQPGTAATIHFNASSGGQQAFAALPSLVSYPYGCAEQTLNRFLPTLIAFQTVERLGLDWDTFRKQMLAESVDSLGWIRGDTGLGDDREEGAFTREYVRGLVIRGIHRLGELRQEDGGWGWFGGHESDPYLTAQIKRGLLIASRAGFDHFVDEVFESGDWLAGYASDREGALDEGCPTTTDAMVYYVQAPGGDDSLADLRDLLLEHQVELPTYAKILLALGLLNEAEAKVPNELVAAIHEEVAGLDISLIPRKWWNDPIEINAYYLMFLSQEGAQDVRIAHQVSKLLAMRSGGQLWKSTRDSALCIEAIAGTLEIDPFKDDGVNVAFELPGGARAELELRTGKFWSASRSIPVPAEWLLDGGLDFTLICERGMGVNFDAQLVYQSTEPQMQAAAGGMEVSRLYYRVTDDDRRVEIRGEMVLAPGDLMEVVLKVESTWDLEFVHLYDPRPAGLEPVEQLSGREGWWGHHREVRHSGTDIFVRRLLADAPVVISYQLRATGRGTSTALPARAEAMYSPAIFGRSAGRKFLVE